MEQQLLSIANQSHGPAGFVRLEASPAPITQEAKAQPSGGLTDVLFEQLDYLIQYADQEPRRFERVKAILMEPFN